MSSLSIKCSTVIVRWTLLLRFHTLCIKVHFQPMCEETCLFHLLLRSLYLSWKNLPDQASEDVQKGREERLLYNTFIIYHSVWSWSCLVRNFSEEALDKYMLMIIHVLSFIHLFIHSFKDLYSTSSRKLLTGGPNSSTVKKNSVRLLYTVIQ